MAQAHREASQRLFDLAEQQQGFSTTKQAKAAGFAENTHPYHVQAGNWIREHRGIYRLAKFPISDRPDLVLWSFWSRNRKEEIEGYSHQTALSLHELSDLNPAKLHMTVPNDETAFNSLPERLASERPFDCIGHHSTERIPSKHFRFDVEGPPIVPLRRGTRNSDLIAFHCASINSNRVRTCHRPLDPEANRTKTKGVFLCLEPQQS